jgi:hypothetical protein
MIENVSAVGHPHIKAATVLQAPIAGGKASIRLHNSNDTNEISPAITVTVIGNYPKTNDVGVVLFGDHLDDSYENGYWLGSTTKRFITDSEETNARIDVKSLLPEGTEGIFSTDGKQQILITNSDCRMKSDKHELVLNSSGFQLNNLNTTLSFDKTGFNVYTQKDKNIISKLSVTNTMVEVATDGMFLFKGKGDIYFKTEGNIFLRGNSIDKTPLDLLQVDARRINLNSGPGPIVLQGSSFNVKLGSSQFGTSTGIPGTAPLTTASIEVVQGNMDYSVGVGNINIRALSPAHTIKIINGALAIGAQSYFAASGVDTKMGAELVPGTGATITTKRTGEITLDAFNNIIIKSSIGNINLEALNTITLKSVLKTLLQSVMLDIKADAKVAIETLMLDLQNTKVISTGPKIAAPGSGPFCSIPVCPLTGIVHTGERCL